MKFALAGNQNCGKTTLFNQLTGSNQHVGNFPGVTVDRKDGLIKSCGATVVDLPGIYSLSPYTSEEIVTRDYLLQEKPDCIINIVDATALERNLYLTMQLMELGIPMVLALNMMDEVRSNGGSIDAARLSEELGIPAAPITASKNEGVQELVDLAVKAAQQRQTPKRLDFCQGAVHRAIHSVSHMIEDHAAAIGVPSRFAATKLLEGDEPMTAQLELSDTELELIQHTVDEMEESSGMDRNAALADMRYTFLDQLCAGAVRLPLESKESQRSARIDKALTHKYFAIPIFLGIMLLIFWLTFGLVGDFLSDLLSLGIDKVTLWADRGLAAYGINPVVHSLIIDGAFAGIGSVLSFLPVIVTLFFFLSLLEDSGYMARVAFVMDKLLRKIGLSGRSFVPMLIGFGCTVPAVMASRTLNSERDRRMTVLLTPFISCSAKVPIYGVFAAAFFPGQSVWVMTGLYLFGIALGVLSGLVLSKTAFRGAPAPFVMELPSYRLPSPKSVLRLVWDKAKDFITRAFTIIFVASLVIWFLQTFDIKFNLAADSGHSLLAMAGRLIAPFFAPLGFGSWQFSTALITGFTAKEAVVSTLAVLTGSSMANLPAALSGALSPAAALAFLTFTLLYTPCVAAVAAVKREMGGARRALFVVCYQTGLAWLAAFLVYRLALLF